MQIDSGKATPAIVMCANIYDKDSVSTRKTIIWNLLKVLVFLRGLIPALHMAEKVTYVPEAKRCDFSKK